MKHWKDKIMDTASLKLSKELYILSGWEDTYWIWVGYSTLDGTLEYELHTAHFAEVAAVVIHETRHKEQDYPAYDLSYLVRKLPQNSWIGYIDTSGQRGYALAYTYAWNEKGNDIHKIAEYRSDTPEDAACKLAIDLFKQGILKRE